MPVDSLTPLTAVMTAQNAAYVAADGLYAACVMYMAENWSCEHQDKDKAQLQMHIKPGCMTDVLKIMEVRNDITDELKFMAASCSDEYDADWQKAVESHVKESRFTQQVTHQRYQQWIQDLYRPGLYGGKIGAVLQCLPADLAFTAVVATMDQRTQLVRRLRCSKWITKDMVNKDPGQCVVLQHEGRTDYRGTKNPATGNLTPYYTGCGCLTQSGGCKSHTQPHHTL